MTSPTLNDLFDEANWLEWRSLIPEPVHVTELVTTEETRREFLEGARLLRMDKRPRGGDRLPGPSPLQLNIADMLNAGRKFNGILEPRRSTKTTAIQAVILGRCSLRDDYLAGWTMTKKDGGQKTGERFRKDIVMQLDRLYPDPKSRPFIVNTGKGTEHIRWPHGSFFNAYAPGNEAFTSGAYDIAWVDEAQDATPEMTEDLMTSIPPTLDGRLSPQMIGSGTAPDYQKGNLLWQLLTMEGAGVIRHGIPIETDPLELESWEPTTDNPMGRVREMIEANHPGIGYTTPLSDVLDNYRAMTRKAFSREYLSLPGEEGSATSIISQPRWTKSLSAKPFPAELPKVLALAIAIHMDGKWASIAVAWKGKGDKRHVGLIHHQEGTEGFRNKVLLTARKLKRQVIWDEGRPTESVEMAPLLNARPPIRDRRLRRMEIPRAAVLFMKTLNAGDLVQYGQEPLDTAAEIAVRRAFGTSGGWAFGGRDLVNFPDDDVTPLEACSRALFALDDEKTPGGVPEFLGV